MSKALPNGLITFGPKANCTLALCPLEDSLLKYRPSLEANGTFLALFAVLMFVHGAQGIYTRAWGFMTSMVAGCILEIAGYAGRLVINKNPFDFSGFVTQIVCITIAPVFFCSAIYVILSQVILYINPTISRLRPQLYYWIFIPCDVVSLVLQATGGAISCVATNKHKIDVGVDISLAGLIFQVVTLTTFCCLFADYLIIARRSSSWERVTRRMTWFLVFLFLSILFILIRCIYRIYELHGGYFSKPFREQTPFIVLESGIMCVAVLILVAGHPGPVLGSKIARKRSEYEMQDI